MQPVVLVHGGASELGEERREAALRGVRGAAEAGLAVLLSDASALDAAVAAVVALEDDPTFNAGTGACLNEAGEIELDASVMEGASLRAGAICALPPFRNPIRIAHAVLKDAAHVMYAAQGAVEFALTHGFSAATLESMRTDAAVAQWERFVRAKSTRAERAGTVGAVVCDAMGRVAAATSTGGIVGKRVGRVGDTPIIGAGTYADDRSGAASATGLGEAIIRTTLSRAACDLLALGVPAADAARSAIAMLGERTGGRGGIILVDPRGNVGAAFSTQTMAHAIARPNGTEAAL